VNSTIRSPHCSSTARWRASTRHRCVKVDTEQHQAGGGGP
jgi:hypothetical protein